MYGWYINNIQWGPLKCSNSMDSIGKLCVQSGEDLYTYKGIVKIPPLAMVDDLLGMAKCGPLVLNSIRPSILEYGHTT